METSESIGELAKALSAAQGEMENAKRDSENPFFRSKYADLASVRDACKAALAKNGLSVVQMPKSTLDERGFIVSIQTRLMHSSGEWVQGDDFGAIPSKPDTQGIGSCLTYLRRYALSAATGVATEDDDGNAASHQQDRQAPTKRQAPAKQESDVRKVTIKSVADAFKVLNGLGYTPPWSKRSVADFVAVHFQGAAGVDELDDNQLNDLLKMLSEKIDAFKATPKEDTKRNLLIGSIKSYFETPEALANYLKDGKTLEDMTITELQGIDDEVRIRF